MPYLSRPDTRGCQDCDEVATSISDGPKQWPFVALAHHWRSAILGTLELQNVRLQRNRSWAHLETMKAKKDQVAVGMSLANCGGEVNAREVYDFIASQSDAYSAYSFRPSSRIAAAAIDFYLVLGAVGSVASVASILWMAYDKFIAPRKHSTGDSAGIYLAVRRPDGTVIDVWLGHDAQTKEEFTTKFELIIEEAQDPDLRIMQEETIAEIEDSDSWVKHSGKSPNQD